MTHLASALFFVAALIGAAFVIQLTVRQYWNEILAALKGEVPARHVSRAWVARVRVAPAPRPVAARAQPPRHAAA